MSHTVVGIFDNEIDAKRAVDSLLSSGFTSDQIDFTARRNESLNTASVQSTDSGNSVSRFFGNLFSDDEDEAKRYTEVGSRGSIVTVYTVSQEESERAADILDEFGSVDVDERSRGYSADENLTSSTAATAFTTDTVMDDSLRDSNGKIQIIEEDLQVSKREVETGRLRVRSRIVERPVEETLRLREERAWVERSPVNRVATEADLANFREETIEVTEYAERPVVSKSARVVEEISVGKKVEERDEVIRDTVRKTEVDVDNNTSVRDRDSSVL